VTRPPISRGSVRWDRDALIANPAFLSLRPVLESCPTGHFPGDVELTELVRTRAVVSGGGAALRFVACVDPLPRTLEQGYEVRIYREGEVPTRPNNFHDLFNALAWLAFPTTKATLNRLHYRHLMARRRSPARDTSRSGVSANMECGTRGTPRDVLTLFDESGVIVVCCEPELEALLRGFQWKELFWTRRTQVERSMRFLLFGHAIHEKVLRPYKGLTAKGLIWSVSREFMTRSLKTQLMQADAWTAEHFSRPEALESTQVFAPIPVLGVPGWEAANASGVFYDDTSVFRRGRSEPAK